MAKTPWAIEPGELRDLIEIQEDRSQQQTGTGQTVPVWVTLPALDDSPLHRAKVESLTGRELELAQQINAQMNVKVTLRWRPGLKPHMRGRKFDTASVRVFNFEAIKDVGERRRRLEILCVETVT